MARPTPDHGTRACYIRGCRRPECRDANRRYCKQYSIDRHRNGPRRVDAAPAASRIDQWVNDGWAYAQIGRATGTADTQILKIHHRVYRTINPDTERRILAARLDPRETPRHAAVLAVGTVRRGRALNAIGYRLDAIADGIPMAANKLGRILAEAPDTVPLWVAQGMARLYRELVRTPGPSEIARRGAARRGWYGPLAWDDIDNPDEQPDTGEAQPDAPRFLTLAEDGLWLERTQGYSRKNAAARLGVTHDNLQACISRARKQGHLELGEAA